MNSLIGNRKYVIFGLLTLLLVFWASLIGYADVTPVKDRTPQVRDAIVDAVPGVDDAADVTEAHLTAITELDLSDQDIPALKSGDFDGLNALTNLYLQYNVLSSIPSDIFDELTALTNLYLYSNALSSLPPGIFDELTALKWLYLDSNALSSLPPGIFDELTALTRLVLDNNALSSLPPGIFDELIELKALALRGNQITDFSEVEDITSLRALYLSGNPISDLEELEKLIIAIKTAIPSIYIDINILSGRTPQVKHAIVTAAGIQSEDDVTLAHLAAITSLDLSWNVSRRKITALNEGDFARLSSLQGVSLSQNALTSLPEGIFEGLSSLERLILDSNSLTELPANGFDKLTSLKTLDLSSNSLTSLSADVFVKLSTLTDLDLRNNSLTSLPTDVFDDLTILERLDIGYNDLTSLPVGIFDGLSSLKYLTLAGNTVDPIPLTVSLEKVADGQFNAVALNGAPFDIALPVSVTNGSISDGTTTVTISKGSVESEPLNVTRAAGTTASVIINIGTLPSLPSGHTGYTLVKSSTLPLTVINTGSVVTNYPPVFTDGSSTSRSVAMNTASGENIGTAISATDADTGDTLTYSLGGPDASSFSIVSTSGQLQTSATLDYETKSSYSVTVSVSDGNGGSDNITVTINVTDIPLRDRTQQVHDAIVAVTGVNSENDVTAAHLAAITTLNLSRKSITSLKPGDFSGLTSLRWLDLGGNSISDVSALKNLTSLGTLSLGGNSISDISTLENLTSLVFLSLRYNSISDISALENLTSLTNLDLQNNSISNISALENLTLLRNLNLSANYSISDISVLKNLTSVVYLNLEQNSISDVSALAGLISLVDLDLKNNLIADYGPLRRLKAANPDVDIDVDLNNNPPVFSEGSSTTRSIAENTPSWRNIGAPVSATDADNDTLNYFLRGTDAASFSVGLRSGQLQNRVSFDYDTKSSYSVTIVVSDGNGGGNSIDVTINVTEVIEIDPPLSTRTQAVRDAIVAAVPGVNSTAEVTGEQLAAITALYLSNQNITTLKAGDFDGLTTLSTLWLSNNSISDLSPLEDLTALTYLELYNNSISDLSPLKNLTTLTSLHLSGNSISDISLLEDLTSLINLSLGYNSISDITKLKGLTSLTSLSLGANSISDISVLEELTSLTRLDLFDNSISDISILEDLTSLTHLHLSGNSISDISALEDLTSLANLRLGSNAISDISALEDLTSLTKLELSNNSISDISALEGLTSLTDLWLSGNPISDYGPLRRLKAANPGVTIDINLSPVFSDGASTTRSIAENTASGQNIGTAISATDVNTGDTLTYSLGGTDASSFSIVSTSGQLQTRAALDYETKTAYSVTISVSDGRGGSDSITVTINITDISDIDPPLSDRTSAVRNAIIAAIPRVNSAADVTTAHLAAITSLELNRKGIKSLKIGDFDGLNSLTSLNLSFNDISDISTLKDLTSLTILNLWFNELSDISPLEELTSLTSLDLRDNSISDISALGHLTSLTSLRMNYNSISDISALEDLTSLTSLSLSNNSISDIPALEDMTSLTSIDLSNNSISDISALEDLTSLTSLSLQSNSISDVSALEDLTSLKSLFLLGNPISDYGPLRRLKAANPGVIIDISFNYNLPQFSDGTSTTRSIAENSASGTNIGSAIAATDADNDTLTYTLGGADAEAFSIDSTTGHLKTSAALDYETKPSYTVTVTVSDGNGGSDSIDVTINVTDVHEIPITSVSDRTSAVRDAIITAVPGVTNANQVTAVHLAAITSLNLRGKSISALNAGDFSGMTALTSLNLFGNQLSNLPDGIFEGLTSLTTIRLSRNAVDPLPFNVSLEKVADGQFKAVAPAGALFNIVLPIIVANGSINGGATTLTIPHGGVESSTLTVTRTAGTTADVTVDIGRFPSLPRTHYGYALVKSDTLPLTVISGINTAPVFTDGASTTRSVAENTAIGQEIGTAVAATDAENDTLTYTLSGNDASLFDIDSTTGQLKTNSALDYETKSSYTVTVTVSDGNLTDTITVTINVTDVQEVVTPERPPTNVAPEFLEGDSTTRSVLENTAVGVNIGNAFIATDGNDASLGYTLGGVDADTFDLDSSGQLKTKAALDFETKRVYTVTITVSDGELSDTITVIISVIDVNDTTFSAGFVPVADRTPEVRDAIVAAVPNVTVAANVTESQVGAITSLNLRGKGISSLKTGDFSGMTALTSLNLFRNSLSSLPQGIFDGLTALTSLRLGGNAVDPIPLIVSLQQVGDGQFNAVISTGAPFSIILPISVTNGSISSGGTSVTIPQGSMESATFTVSGTPGSTTSPTVSIGTLPSLPTQHFGYSLALSNVCNRTEAVAEAIASAAGVSDCSAVTETELAMITSLDLSNAFITSLNAGDLDGMFSLKTLYLDNNDLSSLPAGVFDDLVSLGSLHLNGNKLTTIPNGIFSNLTSLTNLYLQSNDLSSLSSAAFNGLSSLSSINLQNNDFTSLPGGIFNGMPYLSSILLSNNRLTSLPNGIFSGLTQLSQLHLRGNPNAASTLSLTVTLQKVGTNQLKAVAPTGAPFDMMIPIKVTNGTVVGGSTTLVIPIGSVESRPITVSRTRGTVTAVTADIGTPLPSLPSKHNGYAVVKASTLPLEVLPPLNKPPVFKDGANTVRAIAENTAAGTNIGDPVTATDQDANDTLTYTLGGTDAASFSIDSTTGQLKTSASLDFETKSSYTVTLTVSDGLATDTITVTINVTDIDENRAPVFTEGNTATRTVAENTPAGTNIGTAIAATDADNDTLTWTLSGQDAKTFGIETATGQLKTSAALDYETKSVYSVSVSVSDGKITDLITVTINVTDVEEETTGNQQVIDGPSNNAPVFTDGSSTTRNVSEDAATGVDIGTPIAATDADGHSLTYTLGGTDAASFSIDSTNGQLRTNTFLDFEIKSTYSVTITVSDGTDSATISVTINVVDATENSAPEFTAGVSTTRSIAENAGSGVDIGTPISATDADSDTLTYTLGGTDVSTFSIDSTTGQLRTDAFLDYETKSSYAITITVSDGSLTDTINVTINVTDVDEAPSNSEPVFTEGSSTTRSVDENSDSGIDIGSAVSATDADDDTLSYSLSGTDAAAFSIDSTSGQISTSASLDYETTDSYAVTVNVSDGQGGISSISVTISVSDVNDAPVFTAGSSTTRTIAENTIANTNIGTVITATDDDGDTLTYTLGGIDAASFSIDSTTGQLQTQAALDYENKSSYSVIVTASDGSLTDSIAVTINVTPVNEAPTFTDGAATSRQIAENVGANINIGSAVAATDPDGDTLDYTLGGTDAASFAIDATNGQLQTEAALDFETKQTYTVTISVSDGNGGTDVITVTVSVTDLDETPSNNPPIFTDGTSTSRSVAENTASGTNIGSPVAATDTDQNTLAYQLSGTDASSFSIVSTSGQLQTSAALDYETQTSYTVTVTVTDGSSTDTITVTISVTDANDAPQFTDGANTTRSIAENSAASTNIGDAVAATDADGDTLTYTLGGTDASSFSIVDTSGQLRTKEDLDYETKTSYSVTISVSDGNGESDSINIIINVTNVNEAPIFSSSSATFDISENSAKGTNIGTALSATDPDSGDTLTYSLQRGDASSFSIDSATGQISVNDALDYEAKNSYTDLAVRATDSAGSIGAILVTVNVTDVNEAPTFTDGSTISRSVAENTGSGQDIGSAVSATDPDTDDTLVYSLGGDDATSFSIVSTSGQLRTKEALDYETTTSYTVTITVSDGSLTDTITVTINVTDVQENRAPTFSDGSSTSRSVAENTASGQDIGSAVAATDADGDTLAYTLGGDDAASFSINGTTGQLRTSAALNYESNTSYAVTISVSDGNGGSDSIDVTINVTDVNEAPSFTDGSSTTRSIAENTVSGQNIGSAVAATDVDSETTLVYTLSGANAASFSIVSTSGQLQTSAALDYETTTSYSVTITVSDGSLSDSINVTINVTNVNEAPTFTDGSSTSRSVAENTASGQNIGDAVAATDVDSGTTLVYTLSGTDASSFSIVSTSGQLQTSAALDYETTTSYSVTITVSDGSLSDTITVTINVTNVNEAAPTFTDGSSTSRSVAENTASGQNIGVAVSATDSDTGDTLIYSLGGTDVSSFSIVSTTGQLQTSASLDYETTTSYSVTINVSDGSLTDSINVTINVTNVNEAPSFTDGSSTSRSVAENTASDTNIGSAVSATDPDADTTLAYTLGGTNASSFSIVSTTGQLQTSTALDYETTTSYSVTITVSDGSLTDNITVTINVTDVDETIINPALSARTQQVREAIVAAVPGITDADNVTAAHLGAISSLDISNKSITSLAEGDFDGLTSLTSLNLSKNSISNISALEDLTSLTHLFLNNNSISNISALEDLTSLKSLYLQHNSISDISALEDLTTLRNLSLASTSISNISALDGLTNLTSLNLHNNSVSNISALEGLTALTVLHLGYNSISDISALDDLTALTWLNLQQNSITDISHTEALTALTNLSVSGNPISDYGPLRTLKAAIEAANKSLDIDIDIDNNPPVFTDGYSTSRSIAENTASGTNIGTAIVATDTDTDDTLFYYLGKADDFESFSIVGTSGQLQTKAALDYETKSSYVVTVYVSDANDGLDRIFVTIFVVDVTGAAPPVETPPIIPDNTDLLSNFPNPFNPETWIPYQLAKPAEVTLTIYNMRGVVVRTIALGHQAAGLYTSRSRAIHWDGRNSIGEKVASGLYFYTLTAGDFTATRKMLIRK